MTQPHHLRPWHVRPGNLPVVALAIHCGHDLRPEVAALSALSDAARRREEDPHTQRFLPDDATQVVVHRSRFEVDLNRVRQKAVYLAPEDAWGLDLWETPLPSSVIRDSLSIYDRFYAELDQLLHQQVRKYGQILLLDMHSYNHRRKGPHAPPQPASGNPEINLGTEPLEGNWPAVVQAFVQGISSVRFLGGYLDVRENIRFKGGSLCRHVMGRFGRQICPLAVEVKKFFMDEWTDRVNAECIAALHQAFSRIIPGLLAAMKR